MSKDLNGKTKDGRAVAIVRDPERRGGRLVLVDGEQWAMIHHNSHGAGASYLFQHIGFESIMVPSGTHWRGSNRVTTTAARVLGDKLAERKRRGDQPPLKPFDERLMAYTIDLIECGHMRAPAVLKQEREEAIKAIRERTVRQEAEKAEAIEKRAREAILNAGFDIGDNERSKRLIAQIIEAMHWAQTR